LRLDDLTYAGSLVTPSFAPIRFDTAFFVATMPPHQTAEVVPGELDAGEWQSADAILQAWTEGRWLVSPPSVSLLQTIRAITDKAVRYVVGVHFRADHIYGLQAFKDHTDAILAAQDDGITVQSGQPRGPVKSVRRPGSKGEDEATAYKDRERAR